MDNLGIYFTALYTDMTPMPLGTYTATMMLTHNAGDAINLPVTMHIIAQVVTPTADFTATTPVCLGEDTWFYFTGDPGIPTADQYTWWFGDGMSMTVGTPDPLAHVYTAPGTYTVTLEVCITNWGACDMTSGMVEVLPPPVAGFTYWANSLTVTFTDTSMYATSWLWAFGDGMTDTVQNPVHTYAAEGTYTVTQWVLGDCGTDMVQQVLTVAECVPVEIVTVTEAISGCVATFDAELTGTMPYTWLWDFGAFGTSTATNPMVDFGASGTYPYTLTAENCGGPTEWVDEVTVECCTDVQIVTYTYDIAGCVVNFELEVMGTAPFTYLWAFGDGMTSTLAMPAHTYTQTGTYNVTAQVYNCAAGHDMVAFDVTVECGPTTYYLYLPLLYKTAAP
jgi:PKD repeat protein